LQNNLLLIVTGAAFAQLPDGLSIGGWGRADFVPFQGVFPDNGNATYLSGVGSGWGPAYFGLTFSFSEADGRIGGKFHISNGTAVGDHLNIWAKPFGSDILEIIVGRIQEERFRGLGGDDNFHGFIGGPGHDGDHVFQRFKDNASALFISQPIPGLSVFAHLRTGGVSITGITPEITDGVEAKDLYKKIQAGLAYDISGIGLARAQWVGGTMNVTPGERGSWEFDPSAFNGVVVPPPPPPGPTDPTSVGYWKWVSGTAPVPNPARIEAAFRVKAIEGLNLDLGIKIPIPVKETWGGIEWVYQDNFQINVAGDFKAGDFGIKYGLYGAFGGSTAVDEPGVTTERRAKKSATFDLLLIPSFYVAAIDATVGADVGFKVRGASTTGTVPGAVRVGQETTFGFGGWISRELGKSLIKTGLAYQLPAYTDNGIAGSTSYFSWPIILELSF
jgi:hypothetical protein